VAALAARAAPRVSREPQAATTRSLDLVTVAAVVVRAPQAPEVPVALPFAAAVAAAAEWEQPLAALVAQAAPGSFVFALFASDNKWLHDTTSPSNRARHLPSTYR